MCYYFSFFSERIKTKSAQTGYTLNSDQVADIPPSDVTNLIALKAGVVASAGGLHIRGGRAGEAAAMSRDSSLKSRLEKSVSFLAPRYASPAFVLSSLRVS